MLLVKKKVQIQNPSKKRVRKLLLLNYQQIAVVTDTSIIIHFINEQNSLQLFSYEHEELQDFKISSASYHHILKKFYLTVSYIKQKQKHYLFGKIHYSPNVKKEGKLEPLYSFSDNQTKYGKDREIKPEILLLWKSNFQILMRKFYNDTLVIVFVNDVIKQQFYMNEECLSSFDDERVLVSCRKLFQHRLSIDLINIQKEVKIGKFSSNINSHRIDYGGRGIITLVKKIEPRIMLICMNKKQGNLAFLLYDFQEQTIVRQVEQKNWNFLQVFCVFKGIICSYKCQNFKKSNLVVENLQNQQSDSIQTNMQYEEWECFEAIGDSPLILSYTQNAENIKVDAEMIRVVKKKEVYVNLGESLIEDKDETMLENVINFLA